MINMLEKYRKKVPPIRFHRLGLLLLFVLFISSCERLEIKRITKVSTGSVSDITASSAIVQGNIIEQGEGGVKKHGHCWSLSQNPTINNDKTELGAVNTSGTFSSDLDGLSAGTKYYVRAYASDIDGTSYGDEISFITLNIPVPEAPTNLAADPESSTQITLSWTDNSDNEVGFKIERSSNGNTDWAEIAIVDMNVTNFLNINLTPSTTYYYRVRAFNAGGNSGFTNTTNATTTSGVNEPAVPTNLNAEAISSTQIYLSWTDNSNNEEGFMIERSLNGTADWSEIASVGAGITNFENINLTPSTTYYYRVRAYNAIGNSGFSNTVNATTHGDMPIPIAPTDLYADAVSNSEIFLSWTDNSDNEAGFKIERAGASMNWREIAIAGVDTPYFLNAELTASVTYYYRIRAFNDGGNSDYTNTAFATTLSEVSIPAAPSNLSAETESDTEIRLSWTDNSNNEEAFTIEMSSDGGTNWENIGSTLRDTTAVLVIGLAPNTTYWFRVNAYNSVGNSDYSNTAFATTLSELAVPAAPEVLIVNAITSTQLELEWVDMSDNEEGFKIEASSDGYSDWTEVVTVGAGTETYQFTGVAPGYVYYFRVRAYNYIGDSEYSNISYAIACLCPAELNLQHTAGDVAPVTKSVIYQVVRTSITGVYQCWITQNLGADRAASSAYDNTEQAAGWYWQFNRKQGYKHDGYARTPNTFWESYISEYSDWSFENDPCRILLGEGWRIPTQQEWTFAYFNGMWSIYDNIYNGELKLHAAGDLDDNDGTLWDRGSYGAYWSSTSSSDVGGGFLFLNPAGSYVDQMNKSFGFPIRCINDGY
jgi:predicted phage tail protein